MWVFSNKGFFTIAASENSPGLFVVQSRFANHIEQLFPDAEVTKKPYGILRFRATVPRGLVYQKLVGIAESIDYSDLGGSIPDQRYQSACRAVLSTLYKQPLESLRKDNGVAKKKMRAWKKTYE